jgi:hypothetical protein
MSWGRKEWERKGWKRREDYAVYDVRWIALFWDWGSSEMGWVRG